MDRLQRYDEIAQAGVVLASQPEPDHTDVTGRPKPGGSNSTRLRRIGCGSLRVSANSQPVTMEAEEMPAVIGQPQRLRVEPARLSDCQQIGRRTWSDEVASDNMIYSFLQCPKEFMSRSGRSRHCMTIHGCRIARDGRLREIYSKQIDAARGTVLGQSGGHPSRRRKRPLKGDAIASPSSAYDPTASPSSCGLSSLPSPIGLEKRRTFVDGEFVPDAPCVSAEERAAFCAGGSRLLRCLNWERTEGRW